MTRIFGPVKRHRSATNIIRPGLFVLAGLYWSFMIWQVHFLSNSNSHEQNPLEEFKKRAQQFILTVIRIPKTGSTSLLQFLTKESGMTTVDTLLPSQVAERDSIHRLVCIFGPKPMFHTKERSKKQCAHYQFKSMQDWMNKEMAYNDSLVSLRAPIETLTMVRDPFDRMRSLFYYVRRYVNTTQSWKHYFSETQYEMVRNGDMIQWMKEFPMNPDCCGFQFEFVDAHVDKAISMLGSSNITVFVNECFEASLRLMEDYYNLRPGAAHTFLETTQKLNAGAYDETPERQQLAEMREWSKAYFPNEYKFYDAVVQQFKHQLSVSKVISPQLMHECLDSLK